MIQLAPTGLPSKSNAEKFQHRGIEESISVAIREITGTERKIGDEFTYKLSHPDTKALLKGFDQFFSHGLIMNDKCYWVFVREFLPSIEQKELKTRWNASKTRSLSLAWLRDSLNKSNLHFQMLAFISCSDKLKRAYYVKNSCMLNKPMLKRMTMLAEQLCDLKFSIEPPYILHSEEIPIAVVPIADVMMQSPNSISWDSPYLACSPPKPATHRIPTYSRSHQQDLLSSSSSYGPAAKFYISNSLASTSGIPFMENNNNSNTNADVYLDSLVQDLPEVEIPSFTNEPYLSTSKEQDYAFEEMLRKHQKRLNTLIDDEDEADYENSAENMSPEIRNKSSSPKHIHAFDDNKNSQKSPEKERLSPERKTKELELRELLLSPIDNRKIEPVHEESFSISISSAEKTTQSADIDDVGGPHFGEFDLPGGILVDGEVLLDSGEIIHLAMEVFKKDGERFQRLFQVYTGHASGSPQIRFLLLTNQFVYLLSLSIADTDKITPAAEALPFDDNKFFPMNVSPNNQLFPDLDESDAKENRPRYNVMTAFPLGAINYVSLGHDGQTICFKLSNFKVQASENSLHEIQQLLVETGSMELGKSIAGAVDSVLLLHNKRMTEKSGKNRPLITVDSVASMRNNEREESPSTSRRGSQQQQFNTEFDFFLSTFIKRELGQRNVELVFHSLVYWQQNLGTNASKRSNNFLEGFLYVREIPKTWVRKISPWEHAFFLLQGKMLYQFSDSSCKFAQRAINIREIEQVFHVDLKNDAKYVFELTLNTSSTQTDGHNGSQIVALQLQCPSEDIAKKWVNELSLALSISNDSISPVASVLTITSEQNIVIAQEGSNYQIDGFMRALNSFHCKEIVDIWTIRTDVHNALIINRDNCASEWLFFRDSPELNRLVHLLAERWSLPVEDGIGIEGDEESTNTFMQLSTSCARIPDLWNSIIS